LKYLREFVVSKILRVQHVISHYNLSDAFTKPLLSGLDPSHHGYFVQRAMSFLPDALVARLHK
jgi:hypothetical protein